MRLRHAELGGGRGVETFFWLSSCDRSGRRRGHFLINGERLHPLAVQRDFEQFILRVAAEQQIDGGFEQLHLDDIVAIEREIVMDQDAAAGAQRQAFDMLVLRKIGTDAIGVDDRADLRIAHGQAADLARSEQIALNQSGRNAQDARRCYRSRSSNRQWAAGRKRRHPDPEDRGSRWRIRCD